MAPADASSHRTARLGETVRLHLKGSARVHGPLRLQARSRRGRVRDVTVRRSHARAWIRLGARYKRLVGTKPTRVRIVARLPHGRRARAALVVAGRPAAGSHETATGAANGGRPMGLSEDVQYLTGDALQQRLDAYQRLGVRWVRFQLIWNNVQRSGPDAYDWHVYDALVAALEARGMQPLAVVDTTPAWARSQGCGEETCAPADPAAFARFAGAAAARYAGRVNTWEIWNEPNSRVFWKPAPDPAAYAAVLVGAYDAIKAAAPGSTVLTGGTAPAADVADAQGARTVSARTFLVGVYAHGGGGHFDAVGHHPYSFPDMPGAGGDENGWNEMDGPRDSLRALMVAHGDGDKKIWATEFGAHTDPAGEGHVTEQRQAAILRRGVELWSGYAWSGPMLWFLYQDQSDNPAVRDDWFGLVRLDGTTRPAYDVFRAAAAA